MRASLPVVPRVHGGGCFRLDVRVTPQTIPCGKEQGGRGVSGALPVSHPLPLFLHHSPPTGSLLSLHVAGWGALLPFAPEVFLVVSKCVCSYRIILNAQLLFRTRVKRCVHQTPALPFPPSRGPQRVRVWEGPAVCSARWGGHRGFSGQSGLGVQRAP